MCTGRRLSFDYMGTMEYTYMSQESVLGEGISRERALKGGEPSSHFLWSLSFFSFLGFLLLDSSPLVLRFFSDPGGGVA